MPSKDAEKDKTAKRIGARIKQARQMAGFSTQADLNKVLTTKHGWSTGRLGNYEAGHSIPRPDDLSILAKETDTSECWLMFGAGPIRSRSRAIQAIRHQNLVHLVDTIQADKKAFAEFLEAAGTNEEALTKFLDNPFRKIGDRQARRFERARGERKGWMDEQHVHIDPLCNQFPEDLRELMTIYSDLDGVDRNKLLEIARLLRPSGPSTQP